MKSNFTALLPSKVVEAEKQLALQVFSNFLSSSPNAPNGRPTAAPKPCALPARRPMAPLRIGSNQQKAW